MPGWLAALLVCYEDASPIAASPAPTLLVSEARGGHPRHRRDRSKRPRGPPAGVPRLAAHWAAVDALTAVVRARPREAQGVGKNTRQCSELRRAWRRGTRAAHRIYGNKVAVLAGDFLLARASVLLSRLGDIKVVELLATVIEEMVQGELMQVKALPHELLEFDHYLGKTYRKTAALMSLSCQASASTSSRHTRSSPCAQ